MIPRSSENCCFEKKTLRCHIRIFQGSGNGSRTQLSEWNEHGVIARSSRGTRAMRETWDHIFQIRLKLWEGQLPAPFLKEGLTANLGATALENNSGFGSRKNFEALMAV